MKLLAIAVLCLGVLSIEPAIAKGKKASTKASSKSVRKLLQASKAAEQAIHVMGDGLEGMLGQNPQLDKKVVKTVVGKVKKQLSRKQLEDLYIPIYQKYFTQKDVDELTRFYQTPVGKKLVTTQVLLSRDAAVAGENWGRTVVGPLLSKLLQAETRKPTEAPKAPTKKKNAKKK